MKGSSVNARATSRDAKKHSRREKERIRGQARLYDRRTKEMLPDNRDEDADWTTVSTGKKGESVRACASALLAPETEALLRQEIKEVEASRVTRRERLFAFAMARNKRLGAESPAHGISRDVCSVIAGFIPGVRVMVAGGRALKKADTVTDPEFRYREEELSSMVMMMDTLGRHLQVLEPLPTDVAFATLLRYKDEVWCVGGVGKDWKAFSSVFVYSLKTGVWRTVENVFSPPRRGGRYVIYKNTLLGFGGWCENSSSFPQDAVYTMEGKPLWPRGLPQLQSIEHFDGGGRQIDLLLLKDVLIVRCSGAHSYDRELDPADHSFFINLSAKAPEWKPFPGWQPDHVQTAMCVFGGSIFLFGGQIDSGCPTCSTATDKCLRFDFSTSKFQDAPELYLSERVMQAYPVFGEIQGRKKLFLLGGHHTINYGDYEAQFCLLELGNTEDKWRSIASESFPSKKVYGAGIVQLSM